MSLAYSQGEEPLISVVGICSPAPQSGKSTIAKALREHGYHIFSFAEPIKRMAMAMLESYGIDSHLARYYIYEAKDVIIPGLGVTGRKIQITLGTEWGRDMIAEDIWYRRLTLKIEKMASNGINPILIVVDDLRFKNEYEKIRGYKGKVWHVNRPEKTKAMEHSEAAGHRSEADWPFFEIDKYFLNEEGARNFAQFKKDVKQYVSSFVQSTLKQHETTRP